MLSTSGVGTPSRLNAGDPAGSPPGQLQKLLLEPLAPTSDAATDITADDFSVVLCIPVFFISRDRIQSKS